jgi:hypothetical protein
MRRVFQRNFARNTLELLYTKPEPNRYGELKLLLSPSDATNKELVKLLTDTFAICYKELSILCYLEWFGEIYSYAWNCHSSQVYADLDCYANILNRDLFEITNSERRAILYFLSSHGYSLWGTKKTYEYKESGSGYVYLAYCETGHHKIGISATPEGRIKHFDTIMPVSVELQHIFKCDDSFAAEQTLHDMLSEYRFKGEWFSLPREIVKSIKSIIHFNSGVFYHSRGLGTL